VTQTDTRIGSEIAGYRVEALLGRGGMSVVYLVEHMRLGRKAALKVLAPELARDESFRDRFIRESRLAASIDHPNIIPIYDAGEADGLLYIAMRFIDGADLGRVVRDSGALGVGQSVYVIEQLAGALDAAHERGLVHRDVKPANVLIEPGSERVYLTDFGVAKQTSSPGLTKTGYFLGTADYAAPEQIEGRTVDNRTDVYSLGCVLFTCLTGSAPYDRTSEIAVMHAHLAEPPPSLAEHRPGLPRPLDAVIQQAMAKRMEDRYATAHELATAARAAALDRVRTDAGALGRPTVVRPPERDSLSARVERAAETEEAPPGQAGVKPESKRPRYVLAAVLAAALVAVAAAAEVATYFLTRDDGGGTSASPATGTTAQSSGDHEAMGGEEETTTTSPKERLAMYVEDRGRAWDCEDVHAMHGAAASVECSTTQAPDAVEISVFENQAGLKRAYRDLVREAPGGIRVDSGRCSIGSWGGERPWFHGGSETGGRVLCYVHEGASHIAWTLTAGGLPTLFAAESESVDHQPLYHWWFSLRHRPV
jgi:serine/threonine-protein kinase